MFHLQKGAEWRTGSNTGHVAKYQVHSGKEHFHTLIAFWKETYFGTKTLMPTFSQNVTCFGKFEEVG